MSIMMRTWLTLLLLLLSTPASASSEFIDSIVLHGKTESLISSPFDEYLRQNQKYISKLQPFIQQRCTIVSIRNHTASWEIKDQQLFLSSINTCDGSGTSIPLSTFFPEASGPVFAKWFSGTLLIPRGARLSRYIHEYERYLEITVVQGRISSSVMSESRQRRAP